MAEIASLLLSLATLIAALGSFWRGIVNARRINEVHVSINSRMDQLLEATGVAAHAEGLEAGRKETQP